MEVATPHDEPSATEATPRGGGQAVHDAVHDRATPTNGAALAGEVRAEVEPLRILLVDDTDRNLTALEAMLADLDAVYVKARSGEDALRSLLQQDFALVLLDVRMPGLDGFETARLIRARERNRHTPIIFLTAYGARADEARGYALGAVDFLSKPLAPEVLRGKVSALIELHRKNDELRRQAILLRDAERRAHARSLEAERRRWREALLEREMERERVAAAALQRANARLGAVADTLAELLRVTEPVSAAPRLFARAAELGAELGLWYLVCGTSVRLAAHGGLDAALAEELREVPVGDALVLRAMSGREPVVLQGLADDAPPGVARALGVHACAVFPLVAGGRLHGALAFATRARATLGADELAALGIVADHVASALERACLVEELSRSAAELRDADERKDQFLAMLGHELRNPLAPVLNAVKLIQRRAGGDAVLERVVSAADRQIAHMRRLLDDLLDVSRIRNGKIELRKARLDLRRAVVDAVDATQPLIVERGHALDVELPDAPVAVEGDPVRLAQIVANLVQNAAKYTERGGHVSVSLEQAGGEAVLRVRDDGIGIEAAMLPRIFDLFVQAEQGADRAHGGLGLGLTLVRNLVELHGGTVTARSGGAGQGSEFEVRLPALASEAALDERPAPANAGAAAQPRPLQIVLVEDNADIRESLRALLELCGHAVDEAEDGQRGIDLIRARHPDIALVDIGLPGIDGYAVARELRGGGATTRLVAMTGYGRPEDRRLALDAGFDAHLVKPVDFDDLSRTLAELP